jgi:hypothetical protein
MQYIKFSQIWPSFKGKVHCVVFVHNSIFNFTSWIWQEIFISYFKNCDKSLPSKVLLWIWIRIGSGYNDFVDPHPYPD